MTSRKIQATKNYRLFLRDAENRNTDVERRGKLVASMKKYGFIPSFPIVCRRDAKGNLKVRDGQHRLEIAETLGLTVFFCVEEIDFSISELNITAKIWQLKDYAENWAQNGKADYQEGLDFHKDHSLPIGNAFSLLAGTTSFSNIDDDFKSGKFRVKDRAWASAVAGIYVPLTGMSPALKNARFIEACMAICRVSEFDSKRMIASAERCREKLISFSTRDAFLDMLEQVYNFGRVKLVALKIEAMKAMRERNVINKSKKKKADKEAA